MILWLPILGALASLLLSLGDSTRMLVFHCRFVPYQSHAAAAPAPARLELALAIDARGDARSIAAKDVRHTQAFANPSALVLSFIQVSAAGDLAVTVIETQGSSLHTRYSAVGGRVDTLRYRGRCGASRPHWSRVEVSAGAAPPDR